MSPRVMFAAGKLGPAGPDPVVRILSTMAFCRKCVMDRLFVKVRQWPGESFAIAECCQCGNTQAVVHGIGSTSHTRNDPEAA